MAYGFMFVWGDVCLGCLAPSPYLLSGTSDECLRQASMITVKANPASPAYTTKPLYNRLQVNSVGVSDHVKTSPSRIGIEKAEISDLRPRPRTSLPNPDIGP